MKKTLIIDRVVGKFTYWQYETECHSNDIYESGYFKESSGIKPGDFLVYVYRDSNGGLFHHKEGRIQQDAEGILYFTMHGGQ